VASRDFRVIVIDRTPSGDSMSALLDAARIPHDDFMARVDAEIARTRQPVTTQPQAQPVELETPEPTPEQIQKQKIVLDWILSKPSAYDPQPAAPGVSYTFDEVREKIIASFGVEYFKPNGYSVKRVTCPFHDDKHPSATIHREKGLYCFPCGQMYTWKAIAEKLGIPWTVKAVEDPAAMGEGIIGMSRAERRAFIAAGFTNLARVLDVCIDRQYAGQYFTFQELTTALKGSTLQDRCIRQAFDNLKGKNLPEKEGGEFLTDFFRSYTCYLKKVKKPSKTPPHRKTGGKEGRPQDIIRIPTVAEITEAAGVLIDVHYGMALDVIGNAANYRAACMADEIRRKPGTYPRSKIAAPLGISYPTIKAYCDRAGIARTPQPVKKTELTPEEVTQLPENFAVMKMTKGKVKGAYMEDERGGRYALTKAGAMRAAAMGGGKLYRVEYQASDYRPEAKQ
jgi:hypothetical protein